LVGEAPGVKDGGILQHMLREVTVSCLPTQMPDMITADISGMNIGDQLTVGELQAPSEVKIITEPDSIIAMIVPPAVEEKPEAEGEETAAEPAGGEA
jgi:large subunit ribosomal protein L25